MQAGGSDYSSSDVGIFEDDADFLEVYAGETLSRAERAQARSQRRYPAMLVEHSLSMCHGLCYSLRYRDFAGKLKLQDEPRPLEITKNFVQGGAHRQC